MASAHASMQNGTAMQRPSRSSHIRSLFRSNATQFHGKSFALLLAGGAYRSAVQFQHRSCTESSAEGQREAVHGYQSNVLGPLSSSGADVEVLFTFPRCGEQQAHLLDHYLNLWPRSLVAAYHVIDSRDQYHGEQLAVELLAERRAQRQRLGLRPYDYVLKTRHDWLVDANIFSWPLRGFQMLPAGVSDLPARASFEHLLAEQEGMVCEHDTGCNFHGLLSLRMAALARYNSKPLAQLCSLCTRDHMLWIPARFLETVTSALRGGHAGHNLMHRLLESGSVRAEEAAFLFPADCRQSPHSFFTLSMCNEAFGYRPLRTPLPSPGEDPQSPVPAPERNMEEWRMFVALPPHSPPPHPPPAPHVPQHRPNPYVL